ncbi:MAG: hypothetical protein ACO20F_10230 [Robiginitalea sp.]|jgi:hypothetical protein
MKNVVLFCFLASILGLGQMGREGETKFVSNCFGTSSAQLPLLEYTTQGEGGYYTLKYFKDSNARRKGEESGFSFSANKYELEYLRKFLISGFGNYKKKSLKVGENTLYVRGIYNTGYEQDGIKSPACDDCQISVSVNDRSSFIMTKSCVNNLFDIKE